MKNYTLYVDDCCCGCKKVSAFIDKNNINITTVNIDKDAYHLPFSLMIIPALVKGSKLIAYGPDIISYLSKINQ